MVLFKKVLPYVYILINKNIVSFIHLANKITSFKLNFDEERINPDEKFEAIAFI